MVDNLHTAKLKSSIISILKGVVFASLLGLLVLHNLSKPRIMVIHSYEPTMDIVKDFDNGTKKVLENEFDLLIQTYYMNMLNKNTIKQKINAGIEARASIDRFKPEILVAVGDEAQEFSAKFYLGKKNIRIIFAGVKGDFKKLGYIPGQNVGGIIEVPQVQELNLLINSMFPGKKNIKLAHLGDTSTIVNLTEKTLIQHAWKNVKFQDSIMVDDSVSFKRAAVFFNKHYDVLLISSYKRLTDSFDTDDEIASDETMKWVTENTTIPIISTMGYAIEEGAGAAIVSSAYNQGVLAMRSALTMLKVSSYFPNITSKVLSVFLNDDHIRERKIFIPSIYRSFAAGTQKLYGHSATQEAGL